MRLIAVFAAALILSACAHPSGPFGPTVATTSLTAGPSTDCANPATTAQQLVCDDPHLLELDHRLQAAYQQALATPGTDTAALAAAQNAWNTQRDACAQNTDPGTCLQESYQTRLLQLAIADPATMVPPIVNYHCPAEYSPLTAQFYNQFDPPSAVLNWKGEQQILFVQPSGSGARYGRQSPEHWEYWEHQDEVTLDFNGTRFVCRAH